MAVTILEALMNADMNMGNIRLLGPFGITLVRSQLHNAVVLLEKGYSLDDLVEPLLDEYGAVEAVPEKAA